MPRPLYFLRTEIAATVGARAMLEALDDDGDGVLDEAVWDAVAAAACNEVDGILGQRYATPFAAAPDAPSLIAAAAAIFCCETLYLRRGFGDAKTNPFLTRADAIRTKLDDIAAGRAPLTPTAIRPRPSVSVVTEPARTSSAAGSLST